MKRMLMTIFFFSAGLAFALNASAEAEQTDYSVLDRSQVPEQFRWKIEDIYPGYREWQDDLEAAKKAAGEISSRSSGWTGSASGMLAFEDFLSALFQKMEKLHSFTSNQYNVEMTSTLHQQNLAAVQTLYVQISSALSFIQDDILKLGEERFAEYLRQEPKLEVYRFGVEKIFKLRPHILPRDLQEAVSLTNLFTPQTAQATTLLNDLEIPPAEVTLSDGTSVTLNTANYIRYRGAVNAADRALVMRSYWENHRKFERSQAALFDAAMKQHLFRSRVHKYQDCLEAALLPNSIESTVYHNLIKTVRENLAPLHRYLKLKQELLQLGELKYDDIYASSVPAVEKYFSYQDAQKIIFEALKPLGKEYGETLHKAINERWIDVYPNKGKQSGAYSGGVYGVHPFIKMNYNGKYAALSTMAHELGHTMHSFFSEKYQPYELADYPIFLAEIASTFNENLLLNHLLKTQQDDLFKLYLLDSYLDNFRGTVYRQALFAEFELAMHRCVEEGGSLTADWLSARYLELTRFYYGHDQGVMRVDDYIANEWSGIPHFFLNYYVYQYSTGLIASLAMSEDVMTRKGGAKNYLDNFLKAGGSDYPLEILRKAGLDMSSDKPALSAFRKFDDYVSQMEKIVRRIKDQRKKK